MTTISPSLLAADFVNLNQQIDELNKCDNIWFHLDIMDGHFVPNLTFGGPVIKRISEISLKPLDAHLMVTNPEFHIDLLKDSNIHNFTFHYEAVKGISGLISKAKKVFPLVGFSIKPKTSISDIDPSLFDQIDLLLVMSVEPGFGGQSFIEGTWEKLAQIDKIKKDRNLDFIVQVDGGVNNQNAPQLIKHGASNLVAGSYVFKSGLDQIAQKIESLRN